MSIEELELLAKVASKYYVEEKTQNEIAQEMGLSRVKIYRLLKEAKNKNVVVININWPIKESQNLERQFEDIFKLKKAFIIQSRQSIEMPVKTMMGRIVAKYLETILVDGMTMAICMGSSTYEVIQAINPTFRVKVRVAQAVGSLPFKTTEKDSSELARVLSEKLGGEVIYLSSPMIANSPESAQILKNQVVIRNTLDAARNADVVLSGIGKLDAVNSTLVKNQILTVAEVEELIANDAVGDILGQIIKSNGEKMECEYNERVIGITHEEIKKIPISIALANGPEKAAAILGALRSGATNVLCTDEITAMAVLELNKEH